MAKQPIYEFYAELRDYEPKIWRRFQVTDNITMAKLGYIIMSMFEMQAAHLFRFDVPAEQNFREFIKTQYTDDEYKLFLRALNDPYIKDRIWHFEIMDEDHSNLSGNDDYFLKAAESKVKDAVSHSGSCMDFLYDFGDGWNVFLILEKIFIDEDLPARELPRVLDGEGYGIIEDCGGVPGLKDIAEAFRKKSGKQYKEYCEWLGQTGLDLSAFDINDANLRVKKIPRIYAEIYEDCIDPTQASIDFLERKYLRKKPL